MELVLIEATDAGGGEVLLKVEHRPHTVIDALFRRKRMTCLYVGSGLSWCHYPSLRRCSSFLSIDLECLWKAARCGQVIDGKIREATT